jgi:capsular exopolysaccharide synthesis family protein
MSDTGKSIDAAQSEIGKLTTEISQMEAEINRQEISLTEKRTDLREAQKNLENARSTSVESSDTVVISEPAEAPKKPSQNLLLYVGIAGLLGMCLGAGLVFVLGSIDDRIKNVQDVRKGVDLPILGTVRLFDRNVDELVLRSHPVSGPADDFRVLGAHIRRICEEEKVRTLLVTSPTPGNGKSVITSNLALALAKNSLNVIAVDGDLRLPRLHTIFGLAQEDGLSNSLPGGKFNGCLKNTQLNGLKVITSGEVPPNPAELLTSPNLAKLIKGLTSVANIVLIDCPPVLTTADASILASVVDGVVVVLKAGKSDSQAAKSTVEVLRRVKANVVGIVLNAVPERKEEYYGYYRKP